MRLNLLYDDAQQPGPNAARPPDLCNIDFYLNTKDDLVVAQNLINALLNVLPQKPKTSGAENG